MFQAVRVAHAMATLLESAQEEDEQGEVVQEKDKQEQDSQEDDLEEDDSRRKSYQESLYFSVNPVSLMPLAITMFQKYNEKCPGNLDFLFKHSDRIKVGRLVIL